MLDVDPEDLHDLELEDDQQVQIMIHFFMAEHDPQMLVLL